MELSKQEAKESLNQIEESAARMRRMLGAGGASTQLILWGVIWAVGFAGTQALDFMVQRAAMAAILIGALWLALVTGGVVSTIIIDRRRSPVRNPALSQRIGWFWFLLYGYLNLWIYWMRPFIRIEGHEASALFWRTGGAIAATIPMFAYVVMGLWLDRLMIWIGLAITALTFVGLHCFPQWFWIWMAVMGGGTLILSGLLISKRWR